jgi:hypothetical protein
MVDRSFVDENDAARVELSEFIAGLDERSFKCRVWLDDLNLSLSSSILGSSSALLVERMGKDWAA